jgi:hypothetical protein
VGLCALAKAYASVCLLLGAPSMLVVAARSGGGGAAAGAAAAAMSATSCVARVHTPSSSTADGVGLVIYSDRGDSRFQI